MSTSLPALLDGRAPPRDVSAWLDALDHPGRVAALAGLGRAHQRALYEGAADNAPLTLADFVPEGAPLAPVDHHGVNTLPLPASGRRFTKVMARRADGAVIGWNRSPYAWWLGPGYFTLRATAGDAQRHGAVVVDYYATPWGEVPPGWPRMLPNWFGPQAFVYGWCHDYLRRVSAHVTIGAAFKWGYPVGSWFALTRDPTP